jgi:hypothetical protein
MHSGGVGFDEGERILRWNGMLHRTRRRITSIFEEIFKEIAVLGRQTAIKARYLQV